MLVQIAGRLGIAVAVLGLVLIVGPVMAKIGAETTSVEECTSWTTSSAGDRWCGEWSTTTATTASEPSKWAAVTVGIGGVLWALSPLLARPAASISSAAPTAVDP